MKALIVEPSRMISSTLAALFGRYGIDARATAAGQEALAALESEYFDLLCFAYELADMNGIDFLVSARALKLHHHQPALMFAATHDKAAVSRALEAGVTECFSKLHPMQFEQFVEKFAQSHRARLDGTVLLVEDSAATALFYRHILQRLGLRVDICNSAEQAIERFDAGDYDLVLTDYILAGTETGFAVLRAVRATPGRKADTPIIVVSSFDDTARKVEVLRNGANDFVAKPAIAEELEVRVSNQIVVRQLMRRLESQHEAMRAMAMHDQLTALYNRYYLEIKAAALIESAHAAGAPLALLVIDLDRFKAINDTHGHKAGDHVLEQVANALRRHARAGDVVARVGGEEFVCLMPGIGLDAACAHAEELCGHVAALRLGGIAATASLGVAALAPGENYDALFHRADMATYRAKANGRNRVETAA